MSNQTNVWLRRQHLFDRIFPVVIGGLIAAGIYLSYQITLAKPEEPAGNSETSSIIKEQLAILDQYEPTANHNETPSMPELKSEGPINLRTATTSQLESLPGIGEKRAQQIVALRDNGQIRSVNDLQRVKGIGEKLFSEIEDKLIWE